VATVEDVRSPQAPARRPRRRPPRLWPLVERIGRVFDAQPRIATWLSWALLGAYAVMIAVGVARHEPWFDEAQAWLLARDAGVVELFTRLLRYEGSPGLWHLLLMVPAKLGLPYVTIQVVAAALALAGAALVAFRSPFPPLVRLGLLFSYVIGYQYALVARSYTLAPVLLFALALAWPSRREHVWRVTLLLALLANASLHGFLVAGSLAAVHTWETLRTWGRLDTRQRRAHLLAGAALLAVAVAVVAVLLPPEDLSNAAASNLSPLNFVRAAPRVFNNSLTGNPAATLVAVLVSCVWFWRTRTLLLWALPTASLVVLYVLRYYQEWHDGLPFLVWVFALWVSLTQPEDSARHLDPVLSRIPPLRRALDAERSAWLLRVGAVGVLAGTLIVQVVWWGQSYAFDLTRPYSGTRELAAYLADLDPDLEVYASSFHAIGALPYFEENPFDNYRDGELPGYFSWTLESELEGRWIDIYLDQPDVIVWGEKFAWQRRITTFPGYRRVARFEGDLYWKNRILEPDAFVIFERT
jgi:hypothetical protein